MAANLVVFVGSVSLSIANRRAIQCALDCTFVGRQKDFNAVALHTRTYDRERCPAPLPVDGVVLYATKENLVAYSTRYSWRTARNIYVIRVPDGIKYIDPRVLFGSPWGELASDCSRTIMNNLNLMPTFSANDPAYK